MATPYRIHLATQTPIKVSCETFIARVNQMRREFGCTDEHKKSVDLQNAIASHQIMTKPTSEHGAISIALHYENDGLPCVRYFPGCGHIDDQGSSNMELHSDYLAITLDYTISSGKSKRQKDDFQKIVKILKSGQFTVVLRLSINTDVDTSGHSILLPIDLSNTHITTNRQLDPVLMPDAFAISFQ